MAKKKEVLEEKKEECCVEKYFFDRNVFFGGKEYKQGEEFKGELSPAINDYLIKGE